MNLVMASVLLLAAVACQPSVIYGAKGSVSIAADGHSSHNHNNNNHNNNNNNNNNGHNLHRSAKTIGKAKRSHLQSSAITPKLMMSLTSGDVLLVRPARGANNDGKPETIAAPATVNGAAAAAAAAVGNGNSNGNGSASKRKSNKKLDKSSTTANGGVADNVSATGGRRHAQEKKYSAAAANQQQQQQQQQQQPQPHHHHGAGNGKNNNKRQSLKSQQHHGPGKRAGNAANAANAGGAKTKSEHVERTAISEKSQSTCRYAKSAWSECDPKTNFRSRMLTLKKGENCPATRTMQKKCRKTCRYEKGAWSECSNGLMTRQDKLKTTTTTGTTTATTPNDANCEALRTLSKKCGLNANANGSGKHQQSGGKANKERKHKDKASRRAPQQA